MPKKLTHEEFDKQVMEALEGPLPTIPVGGGNGQGKLPPGALKALIDKAKARKPTGEGRIS